MVSTYIIGLPTFLGLPGNIERYFISLIDTRKRYACAALLKSRKETTKAIQKYLEEVRNATGRTPRWIVSDNAGEWMSAVIQDTRKELDITHISAIPYKPGENGIWERVNSAIINEYGWLSSPQTWQHWPWALNHVVDKYNQLLHSRIGNPPHELCFA